MMPTSCTMTIDLRLGETYELVVSALTIANDAIGHLPDDSEIKRDIQDRSSRLIEKTRSALSRSRVARRRPL